MPAAIDVPRLADELAEAMPSMSADHQRVAESLFRLLAEGAPVGVDELGRATGLPPGEVASVLDTWPGIERDEQGNVVGFGLTLEPTQHVVEIDGTTLYAWCALDTLIFPLLLDRTAHVRSTPPSGGESVELTVDAAGARDVTPAGAVMSLVHTTGGLGDDVRGRFCCFVHFFSSDEAARDWTDRVEGPFAVSLDDGAQLGRRLARRMFGQPQDDARRS